MSFVDDESQTGDPALDEILRQYALTKPRRFGLFGGQYEDYMNRLAAGAGSGAGSSGPAPDLNVRIPTATDVSGLPSLFGSNQPAGGGVADLYPAAPDASGATAMARPMDGAAGGGFRAQPDASPPSPVTADGVVLPELVVMGHRTPHHWYDPFVDAAHSALDTARDVEGAVEDGWNRLVGRSPSSTSVVGGANGVRPSAEGGYGQHRSHPTSPATDGPLTGDGLRGIMPLAGSNADVYADALNKAMRDHGITSPYDQAAFLAQVGQESGQLKHTRENMNYRAETAMKTWPKRFPTLDAARPYAHNPEVLGNRVYAGRNGNGDAGSGDGYRYRGGGLLQVTGRSNYRLVGHESDPDALAQPAGAADSATAYWRARKLGELTGRRLSRAEFDRVTRKINGGMNGADERWEFYNRALDVLAPD